MVLWKLLQNEIHGHASGNFIYFTLVSENGKRMTLYFKTGDANRLQLKLERAIDRQEQIQEKRRDL